MTSTLAEIEGPGDAELISAVRGGDLSAYGDLFERHVEAARRLARQLTNPSDADDLVSDAFAKVLKVLQGGGGPDLAFRAYLLTAIRRLHIDKIRAASKLHTTDDLEPFDPGVPFRDTAVEGFESAAAAKAFASLPERWQLVLWHTEVEGHKPAEVAPLLGMSANSVSALAYRAREGLRQAFLNSHAEELDDARCRWTHEHLGGYVRHGLSKRDTSKVEKHLDECRGCMAIYLELTEVNSNLGAILAPLLLGGAAGLTYLAGTTGSVAAKGGLLLLLDRAKEVIAANTQVAAVSSVAAVVGIAGVSLAVTMNGDPVEPAEARPTIQATQPSAEAPAPPATTPESPESQPPAPATPAASDPPPAPPAAVPPPAPVSTPASPAPTTTPPPAETEEPAPTEPTPDPTDPTTEPTEPPEEHDLTLSLASESLGLGERVALTVITSGYPDDGTATLTFRGNVLTLGTAPDNCIRVGLLEITCAVSAGSPSVRIVLIVPLLAEVEVTASADNFTDSDPGNNTAVWKSPLLP